MRATDIHRRRKLRHTRHNAPGPRLLRGGAALVLGLALALVLLLGAGAAGGALALRGFLHDLPDARDLTRLPERTVASPGVTDITATDEGGRLLLIDRITDPRDGSRWLPATDLPTALVAATLALEEPASLVDALILEHLRDGRSARPSDARRRLQDRLLARQIDAWFSLAQVLEWTLNTRYYGDLAYGADAAARLILGKPATGLSVGEAALLAALGRDPSVHPFDDPAAAERARVEVLQAMAARGFITEGQAEAAAARPPALAAPPEATAFAPDFARLVRRELAALVGPERLLRGGWVVETTLDPALQSRLSCARAAFSRAGNDARCSLAGPDLPTGRAEDAAALVVEPTAGEVLAVSGNPGQRPIGTLIRPFIYLTALSQGYTAATPLLDLPLVLETPGGPVTVQPEDGDGRGPQRLRQALAQDRAVPAAQLLTWIGAPLVADAARTLGLSGLERPPGTEPAFAGDGGDASLLELARAFATLANGGQEVGVAVANGASLQPTTVRQIRDANGTVLFTNQPRRRDILTPALAYLLDDILSDPGARCAEPPCDETASGKPAQVSGRSAAGGDSWAVAYAPQWAVASWASGAPAEPMLEAVLDALEPAAAWSRPAGLREIEVCALSGLLPARSAAGQADCERTRELFIVGTEPQEVDTSAVEIAVNRETGRLGTYFSPPSLLESRPFVVYPPELAGWAERQGATSPPSEFDTIRRVPTAIDGRAGIIAPAPWTNVSGLVTINGIAAGDGFSGYRLAYFPELLPDEIHVIAEGTSPVTSESNLGSWDTTGLNGLYTLILTVFREDGMFDEIAVPVSIQNPAPGH